MASRRSSASEDGIGDSIKRMTSNCLQSTGLCCFKLKEQTNISVLDAKIVARQKKFGVDYITLVQKDAPESKLKECLRDALNEIEEMQDTIDDHLGKIDDKTHEVSEKIKAPPGKGMVDGSFSLNNESNVSNSSPSRSNSNRNMNGSTSSSMNGSNRRNSNRDVNGSSGRRNSKKSLDNGRSNASPVKQRIAEMNAKSNGDKSPIKKSGSYKQPSFNTPPTSPKSNGAKKTPTSKSNGSPVKRTKSGSGDGGKSNGMQKSKSNKKLPKKLPLGKKNSDYKGEKGEIPEEYKDADPSKWKCKKMNFNGQAKGVMGKQEKMSGSKLSLDKGIEKFKANPGKYHAILYQSDMPTWPVNQQQYTLLHREGTEQWAPMDVSPKGWMTVQINEYERLKPFPDDVLPKKFRDKHTDSMTFKGKKLHGKNKPIMPGRGMGVGDTPALKIIGDVDPSDIFQGSVGDCWLLSGISSVAEFDGAIKKLFRKTPNLEQMPWDGKSGSSATGNTYTITLWDLRTWKEVDVVIDERLPAHIDGSGKLLAGKPSEDGELWACYLEKALAIHCGGWDKLVGGQCTHAWAMLTGCREQYTMMRNPATGKWRCFGKCNPKTGEWAKLENSPQDCAKTTWRVDWPDVGGGGKGTRDEELDDEEMFMRLYAWDQVNFIVSAGTKGTSDKNSTGGLVDNHAYSVIESIDNVAGTEIDLIKVRNPWGSGEIEDGEFDDDGPGWDKYPQIKKLLNPVVADDGIFWVTKKEFFVFFQTIYLSASNMTEFIED